MGPLAFARRNFLKRPDLSGLPPRVRAAIAEREWANELLLRSIQLAIILMFCLIYTVSPKTYPKAPWRRCPMFSAPIWCWRSSVSTWGWMREPPDWAAYVSILFDFRLLYGLMISLPHPVQASRPPSS